MRKNSWRPPSKMQDLPEGLERWKGGVSPRRAQLLAGRAGAGAQAGTAAADWPGLLGGRASEHSWESGGVLAGLIRRQSLTSYCTLDNAPRSLSNAGKATPRRRAGCVRRARQERRHQEPKKKNNRRGFALLSLCDISALRESANGGQKRAATGFARVQRESDVNGRGRCRAGGLRRRRWRLR